MKILLLTDGIYPFVMGGMQKHSYYLIKYLTQHNIDLEVVHCSEVTNYEREEFKDIDLSKVVFTSLELVIGGRLPGHYISANKRYSSKIYEAYSKRLKEFDLIYAQGFVGWRFIKERQKGNLIIPVVTNLHGYEMYQKAPNFKIKLQHFLLRPITKYVSMKSDFVFSFGGKITQILKRIGVMEEAILECPIGIEKHWLKQSVIDNKPNRVFVFVGRDERRKGIFELNAAISRIDKEIDFTFNFIGPIPEGNKVLDKRVRYFGPIYEEKVVRNILWDSDVLVCPSYSEGMPTVIMEGMSSGLAIIATDVGAVNQQVSAKNGWLLNEPDVDLIYDTIIIALNISEEELESKKKNSIQHVTDNYLWDKVVERMIELLNEAIIKTK
jgi:glycosyltransferase involved in cell wall biosynthesis